MAVPKNILIVEGNVHAAAAVEALLRAGGCEGVVTAPDMSVALDAMNGVVPDLVLLSLDGGKLPELLAGAHEMRQRLAVPVVYMVNESARTELVKINSSAPSGYVLAPVSARELSIVIDAAQRMQVLETRMRQVESKMQEAQRLEGIGVMAGGIAHDFNNLLTGIFGAVTIAQQDLPTGSPVLRHLENIERAATRAADLCQRLQEQVRQGAGARVLLSLDAVVEDALKLAQSGFKSGLALQTGLAGNLPMVRGYEAQLRQMVANLVVNSAEAVGDAKGIIRVVTFSRQLDAAGLASLQFAEDARPGDYVVVEVADTGGGMEAKALPRIFDPLYTTKASGRGLGLAATGRIVRKHRGGLSVESDQGNGSVFRVYLPVLTDETPLPGTLAPMMASGSTPGGSVLVVDDDEAVRALAKWVVEKAGFRAVTARDGDEALRIFKTAANRFCLVLLDLTMPRMGGAEVMEGMRAIRPGVPVVIITGHDEEVMAAEAQMGVVEFLQKPFGPDLLRAVLNRHLPKVTGGLVATAQ